jgi:hypothetical protein
MTNNERCSSKMSAGIIVAVISDREGDFFFSEFQDRPVAGRSACDGQGASGYFA